MKPFSCIICNSKFYTELYLVSGKHIVKCRSCGHIQTKDFVEPNYKTYHRDISYKQNEYLLKFFFKKRYQIIAPFLQKKRVVLEIGCSTGVFLDVFKEKGFETWGVEPSRSALDATHKGHTVLQTSFEKNKLPAGKFDLVVMNHVLEHIVRPVPFLKEVHRVLAPDGILFIDVPNANSLSSSLQKSRWPYFLPEEHISHFNKQTLKMILAKANFTILHTKTKSGIFEVSSPLRYLFQELITFKKNFFKDIVNIPENVVSEVLDNGNSISVIAQKS